MANFPEQVLRLIDPKIKLDGLSPNQIEKECLEAVSVLTDAAFNSQDKKYQIGILNTLGIRVDASDDGQVEAVFKETVDEVIEFLESGARFGPDVVDDRVFGEDFYITGAPNQLDIQQPVKPVSGDESQGALVQDLPQEGEDKPSPIRDLSDPPLLDGPENIWMMVDLRLPQEATSYLYQRAHVPETDGVKLTEEGFHVTIAYLGSYPKDEAPNIAALNRVVQRVAATTPPLKGQISGTGRFNASETSDNLDVLYASYDSPGLSRFREKIMSALEINGFIAAKDHGFTPHITLAKIRPDLPFHAKVDTHTMNFSSVEVTIGQGSTRRSFMHELSGRMDSAERMDARTVWVNNPEVVGGGFFRRDPRLKRKPPSTKKIATVSGKMRAAEFIASAVNSLKGGGEEETASLPMPLRIKGVSGLTGQRFVLNSVLPSRNPYLDPRILSSKDSRSGILQEWEDAIRSKLSLNPKLDEGTKSLYEKQLKTIDAMTHLLWENSNVDRYRLEKLITTNESNALRWIVDEENTVQAIARVQCGEDRIHITHLVMAPWNVGPELLVKEENLQRRKAGIDVTRQMIAALIKESLGKGYEGRLSVQPFSESVPLFLYMDFKKSNADTYVLSEESASSFLQDMSIARKNPMANLDSTEEDRRRVTAGELTYLELIEKHGQAMAIPVSVLTGRPSTVERNDAITEVGVLDAADAIASRAEENSGPFLSDWAATAQQWLEKMGSYPKAQQFIDQLYSEINVAPFAEHIAQNMMLANLVARDEVLEEKERELLPFRKDAANPRFLNISPLEAINFFRDKINVPAASFDKTDNLYHLWAFSVSDVTKADMLQSIRWLLDNSLEKGTSYDVFVRQFNRLVGRRGFRPSTGRMRVIFETNIRSAYGAGRESQMRDPDMLRTRKIWVWVHRDSVHPRPRHLDLHYVGIPADNPFWNQIRFPAGFGCKCGAFAVSEDFAERRGIRIENNPPDPKLIADPSFRSSYANFTQGDRLGIIQQSVQRFPAWLQKKVLSDAKKKGIGKQ